VGKDCWCDVLQRKLEITVSPDLDKKLCTKYPEIFKQRHAPMTETCLCWGLAVGDGWYCLIDSLCAALMHDVEQARYDVERHKEYINNKEYEDKELSEWCKKYYSPENLEQKELALHNALQQLPEAVQIKEKFGLMRFYTSGGTEEQQAQISLAEIMSSHICEDCGMSTPDVITYGAMSYIRTLCPKHADEQYGKSRTSYYRTIYSEYKNGKTTYDQFQDKWYSYLKEEKTTLWDFTPPDEKA
jgi:hypothetical protein